jgi:hypothetical protein
MAPLTHPPALRHLWDVKVDVGPPVEVGDIGAGRRRAIPIVGGTFEGPAARGTVLPVGADWQIIRSDDTAEIVARYFLKTDDGATINVVNSGYRHAAPEVLRRLAAGEDVDPSEYYFRTRPVFEVADPKYAWLGRTVCVGVGVRKPALVMIRMYAVE